MGMSFSKPTNPNSQSKFNDLFDDPATMLIPDPIGLSDMMGITGNRWLDPKEHFKMLGFAQGGPVQAQQGVAPQMDLSGLSTGQLAAMASSPMNSLEQMAVLGELGKRMKAETATPPSSTVLQDMSQQAQTLQPSQGAPGSPILSGISAIQAQQQQGPIRARTGGSIQNNRLFPPGPFIARSPDPDDPYVPQGRAPASETPRPRRRSGGGGGGDYLSDISRMLPELQRLYAEGAKPYPTDAASAMEMSGQFAGEDRLAPYLAELEGQDKTFRGSRDRDRWMALANAGFRIMGAPSLMGGVGRGGIALAQGLGEADERYDAQRSKNFDSRLGIARAQGDRDQQISSGARNLFTEGLRVRSNAGEQAVRGAVDIAEARGADRRQAASLAAARDELLNKFKSLLEMGYSEEDARAIIAAAVGGRGSGGGAAGYDRTADDVIKDYQWLRGPDGRMVWGEMTPEQQAAATARYNQAKGLVDQGPISSGGIAGPSQATTERPSQATTTPTDGRPSGRVAGRAAGEVAGRFIRGAASRTTPTRNEEDIQIDYRGRQPGRGKAKEYQGYTYEPG